MAKILMIVSAADTLVLADGTAHPTGYWAEEVAASHRVLVEAGHQVDIATPAGARPTVDPLSLDERGGVQPADGTAFRAYLDSIAARLDAPLDLGSVEAADYDAFYLPGGHAPMADLADDPALGALLTEADRQGRTIAALCHGVGALLSATTADGTFLFAGRGLTGFTNEEERQGGLGDAAPWLVEDRLSERGAHFRAGAPWSDTVVVDGNLITGQNPQSSVTTAKEVLAALNNA
ncbi:thiamine biosynthesis protein ThiJ [Streptomyces cyaneogriseus subsp. noncyanogenus]|uniref:Thiamine biosynthesis protein ThiJ n=1 Tax=Streptomyces cyaneogriseus subsp. noncyanogenus TaxID=477245 RepID=A0A0C5GID4_9ACTN|nr:type 1 glutamine amidotransferase domain-containing protein [Streptomyces cyaneogriseus]AJP04236.1 thiamine biosynthesis protein ThiJ [Streptomyces cyaneogriseus subsp. noncyanogenus]